MNNKNNGPEKDPENVEQKATDSTQATTRFNSGGNDSDYDGGHPNDVSANSPPPLNSDEDQEQPEEKSGNSFNAGGNDSDYDGGHPSDAASASKRRIDSSSTNSKNN